MKHNFIIKTLPVGQLQTNCYIIGDIKNGTGVVIDPGDDAEFVMNQLRDLNIVPIHIIATHGHFDHVLAAFELQHAYQIPFFIHQNDMFLLDRMQESATHFLKYPVTDIPPQVDDYLKHNMKITIGEFTFVIIDTPGHTPGSICLYSKETNCILTGDTLFADGTVGRTDFKYASGADLEKSIITLLKLPKSTQIFPGHGKSSTIETERKFHNTL